MNEDQWREAFREWLDEGDEAELATAKDAFREGWARKEKAIQDGNEAPGTETE